MVFDWLFNLYYSYSLFFYYSALLRYNSFCLSICSLSLDSLSYSYICYLVLLSFYSSLSFSNRFLSSYYLYILSLYYCSFFSLYYYSFFFLSTPKAEPPAFHAGTFDDVCCCSTGFFCIQAGPDETLCYAGLLSCPGVLLVPYLAFIHGAVLPESLFVVLFAGYLAFIHAGVLVVSLVVFEGLFFIQAG